MRQTITFQFEEVPVSEGDEGVAFIIHKALLLKKLLQTKTQVSNNYLKFYDLPYLIFL